MRIVKIDLPDLPAYGLKAMKADRLGSLVILAGKNGSGKTRFLKRLAAWATEKLEPFAMTRYDIESKIGGLKGLSSITGFSECRWWESDSAWNSFVSLKPRDGYKTDAPEARKMLYDLGFDRRNEMPKIVHFVPRADELINPQLLNPRDLAENANRARNAGVQHLANATFCRLQHLQNRWWNATHQGSHALQKDKDHAVQEYETLKELVLELLGTSLNRDLDGNTTLFGKALGQSNLSDGQRVLLQFCVAVHAQAQELSELIVLMDEPENHLHPGAMLDVIEKIRSALKGGQLWIATHSVPLLSNFDADCIWWMNDGTLRHAGSNPDIVLEGLIGGEERISKLSDFLGLPAVLAANNFAFQCMLPPTVIETGKDDPQTTQIQRLIMKHRPGQKLSVLDFGAGRARLLSAMADGRMGEELKNRIDYRAYDSSDGSKEECEAAVTRVYGTSHGRCFFSEKDLRSNVDESSLDIIVMCNVLHEVDPTDWLSLFSCTGLVGQYLKPEGFLLLVEDTEMRIGERAHSKGFMVFDTTELRTLFAITTADAGFVHDDARGDGRLKAHLIPAACVHRITRQSLSKALHRAHDTALAEIKKIRFSGAAPSYRDGRKHAFQVQQLANSQLALASLGGEGCKIDIGF